MQAKGFSHKLALVLIMVLTGSMAQAADYLVHAGTLIDGVSGKPMHEVSIHISEDRITGIDGGYQDPKPGETLVDLRNETVMPGLMDMHTHVDLQVEPGSFSNWIYRNPTDNVLAAIPNVEKTLMAGFTTVRNLGGTTDLALRDAIKKGYVIGPRIYSAGRPIGSTGGHADPTDGLNDELQGLLGDKDDIINSPYEARKAVRQHYKDGVDVIKIMVTGGVLDLSKSGDNPQLMDDELKAIVETANDYHLTVAVHAHGSEGMKRAVLAGVTSIEHGTYMTPEIRKLMKQRGTWYVPTLTAGEYDVQQAPEFPPVNRPKALTIGAQMEGTFAAAYKDGIKIAFGTDAGVFPHGENWKEFGYMVKAGMKPMDAIQSATIHAAELLRVEDELGSIEVGKIADLVAVPGDPLADISLMGKVNFVMKEGHIYKGAAFSTPVTQAD